MEEAIGMADDFLVYQEWIYEVTTKRDQSTK